jgi:predicted amidohydrolase YtcJ
MNGFGGRCEVFMDGVVESHTRSHVDSWRRSKLSGKTFWDPTIYKQMVAELDKRGIRFSRTRLAIGSVRLTHDAYENAAKVNGTNDRRHRIEHIETITRGYSAFHAKLGVIASSSHCTHIRTTTL